MERQPFQRAAINHLNIQGREEEERERGSKKQELWGAVGYGGVGAWL